MIQKLNEDIDNYIHKYSTHKLITTIEENYRKILGLNPKQYWVQPPNKPRVLVKDVLNYYCYICPTKAGKKCKAEHPRHWIGSDIKELIKFCIENQGHALHATSATKEEDIKDEFPEKENSYWIGDQYIDGTNMFCGDKLFIVLWYRIKAELEILG